MEGSWACLISWDHQISSDFEQRYLENLMVSCSTVPLFQVHRAGVRILGEMGAAGHELMAAAQVAVATLQCQTWSIQYYLLQAVPPPSRPHDARDKVCGDSAGSSAEVAATMADTSEGQSEKDAAGSSAEVTAGSSAARLTKRARRASVGRIATCQCRGNCGRKLCRRNQNAAYQAKGVCKGVVFCGGLVLPGFDRCAECKCLQHDCPKGRSKMAEGNLFWCAEHGLKNSQYLRTKQANRFLTPRGIRTMSPEWSAALRFSAQCSVFLRSKWPEDIVAGVELMEQIHDQDSGTPCGPNPIAGFPLSERALCT